MRKGKSAKAVAVTSPSPAVTIEGSINALRANTSPIRKRVNVTLVPTTQNVAPSSLMKGKKKQSKMLEEAIEAVVGDRDISKM